MLFKHDLNLSLIIWLVKIIGKGKLQHIHWKDVAFLIFKAAIISIFMDEMIVCDMKGVARRDQPIIYHATLQFPSSLQSF